MDRRWLLVAGVAAVALAAGIAFGRGVSVAPPVSPPEPPVAGTDLGVGDQSGTIAVHVAGWVVAPGVVELAEGSRVGDALAAAGGVRPGAPLDTVNLAQPLVDGQQVVVPAPGTGGAPVEPGEQGPTDDGLVSVNLATAAEIEQLPGVGPVLAERIVAHREAHGPFETVEDLLEVSGIGEAKLEALRAAVVVP